MVEIWFFFMLGMLTGAAIFVGYGYYQFNKIKKAKENLLDQLYKKTAEVEQKKELIKDRLTQASELAKMQMELRAQAEMPSKNAVHSKYKNDLVHEINDMEHRKLDLLRTILAEGFDPTITVFDETGQRNEVPLSSYVNEATNLLGVRNDKQPEAPKDTGLGEPKKVGKFLIYKGGKDDGTTH